MTMTTVFELISILSLLALTVILYFSGETKRSPFDTQAETMWTMREMASVLLLRKRK